MSAVAEPRVGYGEEASSLSSSQDSRLEGREIAGCEEGCEAFKAQAGAPILMEAQRRWAAFPLVKRLQVLRRTRHAIATQAESFAKAISPDLHRTQADTLVSEVLPLLDAIRFLERRAAKILASQKLGSAGRPVWLTGVQAEIERVPLGHVVVIGPANFPLFLPGVQAMQALAAGNAVTWKPGTGGGRVASLVAHCLRESGLPRGVMSVTGESLEEAQNALAQHPDKVVFTGSFASGQQVMHKLAETATPSVMELSGADAVVVLPSANLAAAAEAIAFGLRINGGEVCMSPRRLVATRETMIALRPLLDAALRAVAPVALKPRTAETLHGLLHEAMAQGAHIVGAFQPEAQRPLLIEDARVDMSIARSDVFAPVLSILQAPSVLHISDFVNNCPYALTAAIFGGEREARALGKQLRVGAVLVNDVIAPTVDPRVPFGGRGSSGFGSTRGAEGLLEMTAAKTVLVRHKASTRQYKAVGPREMPLFLGVIGFLHGGSLASRFRSMRAIAVGARKH